MFAVFVVMRLVYASCGMTIIYGEASRPCCNKQMNAKIITIPLSIYFFAAISRSC